MLKKTIKNTVKFMFRKYYELRHNSFVWFSVINRRGRKLYRVEAPKFSEKEQEIITTVERDGIAFARASDFFSEEVFKNLEQFVEKRWNDEDVQKKFHDRGRHLSKNIGSQGMIDGKSYFLIELWDGLHALDLRHIFLQFSLSKPILHIVSGYLQMFPKFRYWSLEATVPNIEGDEGIARASQRWHRDPDDKKMLKIFLYLNDVDEEAGPFTYVKGSHSMGRHRFLFPGKPPQGTPKLPKIEDNMLPHEDIVMATGKAGSLIFADTSGLHRGGFAKSKNRFMYTSAYMSEASVWPMRFSYPKDFNSSLITERLARFAVENNPRQKEPKWY